MPLLDGPTRPLTLPETLAAVEVPGPIVVIGLVTVALWAATVAVALTTTDNVGNTVIAALFSVAATSTNGVLAWIAVRSIKQAGRAGRRALQLVVSETSVEMGRTHALLEQIATKLDATYMTGYSDAVKDLTSGGDSNSGQDGHVVSIGRARVKRDN
jgi:hypothetical protein